MPTLHDLLHHYWKEGLGLFTLVVSLWIAFGPLRHRLPKILTRFGKYSATLKLTVLSTLCWIGFYRNMTDEEPSLALNWVLAGLGMLLLAGALFVLTRKQAPVRASRAASVVTPAKGAGAKSKPVVRKSPSAQAAR
jgi:hypothetical protein